MPRLPALFCVLLLCVGLALTFAPLAVGEEEPEGAEGAPEPAPTPASDEEAGEALAVFKKAFAARGYRGDEKIAAKDFAMRELAVVQHPDVIEALAKATKDRDAHVRTAALLHLGRQRAFAGLAGKQVVAAIKRNRKDVTFLMAGLECIGELGYLGATDLLKDMMRHPDYAVVKHALMTIGELKDVRFVEDIVKLMKKLKLEKGAKWEGVSVAVDTGAAGDADQKAAEAAGKAKEAQNKRKGKRAARGQRDIGPVVLLTMKDLTGQSFTGSISARKWLEENPEFLKEGVAAVEARLEAQRVK